MVLWGAAGVLVGNGGIECARRDLIVMVMDMDMVDLVECCWVMKCGVILGVGIDGLWITPLWEC